ncbi:MAG: hypothetical protein P9L99_05130 [Candidatus Lernaella stagnicola]|nr:hypothetical protein [Candidatus Lernaella stagnicola]
MQQTEQLHSFKFRFISNGAARSIMAKKGEIDDERLILDGHEIRLANIADTERRDDLMVLTLYNFGGFEKKLLKKLSEEGSLVLKMGAAETRRLERQIDRVSSVHDAKRVRVELEKNGEADKFRVEKCPVCDATINLSNLDRTNYIHCRYCDTLLDYSRQPVDDPDEYYACDECGMYSQNKSYTIFNFYFLLLFYGFSHKKRYLCPNCAHKAFVKAMLLNVLFILGIPSAIWIKIKAMQGRDAKYENLCKANRLASDGKYQEADQHYQSILVKYADHPGILLNQALAHFNGEDVPGGVAKLERIFQVCANYNPALRLARAVHKLAQESEESR